MEIEQSFRRKKELCGAKRKQSTSKAKKRKKHRANRRSQRRRKKAQSKGLKKRGRVRANVVKKTDLEQSKFFFTNNLKKQQFEGTLLSKITLYNSEFERISSLQRLINLNSQEFQYDVLTNLDPQGSQVR